MCVFFSRRRGDTRFKCDWSSDVCSSDLATLVDRIEKCAPHWIPVADADPRVALGAAGGSARGQSRMGRNCGGASHRIPCVASRAGLDDRNLGLGRRRSMEETVACSSARCHQLYRLGGWLLFRTDPVARACLPREKWPALSNGKCEPHEREHCPRIERQHHEFREYYLRVCEFAGTELDPQFAFVQKPSFRPQFFPPLSPINISRSNFPLSGNLLKWPEK